MGRVSGHTPILRASLFALLVTLASFAQQPKVLAPHKPIARKVEKPIKWLTPAMPRTMVGGLWMIDANFKSSIYLRNVVETDPVTVTPILYLSNGTKYTLPDVTVEPAGITIISINDALQKKGISSFATLSGYVELQYKWPWDPFCATVRNVDVAHSLIFTYGLRPTLPLPLHILNPTAKIPTHTMEGMWWKQESNVTGFVSLANLSSQPAQASVQVTNKQGKPLSEHNVTVSPRGMKMVALRELATLKDTQGGVRVVSSETTDNLVINGGLEDPAVGYSATLPFALEPVDPSKPVPINIAELGLMAGVADPMMLFPAGTTFTPYSVLRNVSDAPVLVTPTLWWMEGGVPHSARLPRINLLPYQTESLDVMSLLSVSGLKNFNGSFNLVFDGEARRGALVLASGSVDQTNTYVFEVVARGVTESAAKSLQYWSTGNGDDTMVAVWNPADEAQDFAFTLFFTGGHYIVPLHLEARATRTFNVSEIVQNQVPDAEGNVIPASVHEGTAKIAGRHAENEHILVGIDSGIYNVRKATCYGNCLECDGYTAAVVDPNSFAIGVNGTVQLDLIGTWGTGAQYSLSANWSSSKASVATVAEYTGTVTGVASGSVTVTGAVEEPVQVGYVCLGPNMGCPEGNFGGGSGGSVDGFTMSASQSIMDGGQGTFKVTVTGGTAKSYNWSFTSPNGAGNAPNVQFSAATSVSTNTDGHWFALPNVACPAPGDIPAYYNAVYNIAGAVTFNDSNQVTHSTTLTVNSLWNPAGITDPNVANIGGVPAMAADSKGVWRVTGMGTLSRVVPTNSTIYVIPTSQFYNKTVQHEQVHVNNWILGAGHLYGDLFIPTDFYNQIQNTTGTSQADLITKLGAALSNYDNAQGVIVRQRHNQDEHQAYAVSDTIAPQYVYQNCGRY